MSRVTDQPGGTGDGERSRRPLKVAIAGGDLRAASMVRLLAEVESIELVALAESRAGAAGAVAARELGIATSDDVADLAAVDGLGVILDLTDDPELRARLVAYRPAAVEIVGAKGADLIRDLLMAKKRGEEQERLLAELEVAYEKMRGHENMLQAGTVASSRRTRSSSAGCSEIFFTHEFFKALTSFTTVDDVTSLVVDGANGILGAEISCVYLLDAEHWELRYAAAQGRPPTTSWRSSRWTRRSSVARTATAWPSRPTPRPSRARPPGRTIRAISRPMRRCRCAAANASWASS